MRSVATMPASSIRDGQSINVSQVFNQKDNTSLAYSKQATNLKELKVYVTQCDGLPVDAEQVSVIMYKDPNSLSLKRIGEYPGRRIARGIYSVVMPSDQAIKIDVNKVQICEALKEVATTVSCSNVSKVLRKIAKTAGKLTIPSVILTEMADRIVEETCELMAEMGTEKACEKNFDDTPINLYTGDVGFLATVIPATSGKPKYLPMQIVDGENSKYPDLKAELGGETKVNTLTLTPDRPLAKQSYLSNASITCLPYNSVVSISVVGTDGYKDSRTLVVQNLDANGNFVINLSVPGALSGVKDDIYLKAKTPTGKEISQTATLIFQ
jgi:hypothetical protein